MESWPPIYKVFFVISSTFWTFQLDQPDLYYLNVLPFLLPYNYQHSPPLDRGTATVLKMICTTPDTLPKPSESRGSLTNNFQMCFSSDKATTTKGREGESIFQSRRCQEEKEDFTSPTSNQGDLTTLSFLPKLPHRGTEVENPDLKNQTNPGFDLQLFIWYPEPCHEWYLSTEPGESTEEAPSVKQKQKQKKPNTNLGP